MTGLPRRRPDFKFRSRYDTYQRFQANFLSKVEVEYDLDKFSLKDVPLVALINQGAIGISQSGRTSFYSGGFCGCLGLIIRPTKEPGGLVSHISQTGNKQGRKKQDYLLEATDGALQLASKYWDEVNLILFRGDVGVGGDESSVEFPEMANVLRWYCKSAKMIRYIHDIRRDRQKGDQLLFDTYNHKLYPFTGALRSEIWEQFLDIVDETTNTQTQEGTLELETSKNPMPWRLYE